MASLFIVWASSAPAQAVIASQTDAEVPQAPPFPKALDLSAIDDSADPCTDFYQYACGNWIKNNPVPDDQAQWVRSFSLLQERHLYVLWQELARAAAKPASPLEKKYGDFFGACMDVEDLQKKGLEPFKPSLERVSALNDYKGIAALMGDLAAAGDPAPLFGLSLEPDPHESSKRILSISQGGLTLPDHESYSGPSRYIVRRYLTHIARVFMLAGDTQERAGKEAVAVLGLETALARAYADPTELADPEKRYHILALADLKGLMPDFDFSLYLGDLKALPIERLNVVNPNFLKAVDVLSTSVPVDSWRSYFRWHILSEQAEALPKEFRDEDFAFWGGNVGHQVKAEPRWKQCTAITDNTFADAIAQNWANRNFSPGAKADTERLAATLEKAFAEEIRTLLWMSDETKKIAEGKVAAIRNRVGYAQKWRDYSGPEADRHDFLGNLHRKAVFERNYRLSKLREPVDPDEWDMTLRGAEAYYSRSTNSLYLAAGILQPPFFDSSADAAVNFGGIGVLAAHELTHGFDGLGSKFDKRGNVRDWQTSDDRKEFAKATKCEALQYRKFAPKADDPEDLLPGKENDNAAVAEGTADEGGLQIAFRALTETLLAQRSAADQKIDGFTEKQRFFLSYAQLSCENRTFFSARQSMSADPHSIGRVRVSITLQNIEEFGRAFHCGKGKPMYPENSCRVW